MTSRDVLVPALLVPIPLLSLVLFLCNAFFLPSTPIKRAIFLLITIFAAVASGTALGVACGQPLRIVAKVFSDLLQTALSAVSICALGPFCPPFFCPSFFRLVLFLIAFLVACEFVSTLVPTAPPLLPTILGVVSRTLLLLALIVKSSPLRRRRTPVAAELIIEKGLQTDVPSVETPRRVASIWPFSGSLVKSDPLSPSVGTSPDDDTDNAYTVLPICVLLPLALVIAQLFATLAAAFDFASCVLPDAKSSPHFVVASSGCILLWSLLALLVIQIHPCPHSPEEPVGMAYEQGSLRGGSALSHDNATSRKPVLSPRESDSLLDFLSLRDPFASSPPQPPPLPPVGLGLDEVDVGWNGNKEIGMQYRFPAPRSIVKGSRRKEKNPRVKSKKRLVHQDSSRTLLPVPEARGTDVDAERDRGLGDEARLAQLLLQSLSESGEDAPSPIATAPVTVQSPQVAHVQQASRWSASTTVQSTVSGSISNRSGVSTYTTCASEKIPQNRISMNTIASVLGSRKSLDARRKSGMNGSSSKG